jgi:steroid delta-isomerase-like uncharacterized protein
MYPKGYEVEPSIAGRQVTVNRPARKETKMTPEEMKKVHDEHVAAEARADVEASLATYVDDCFYEVVPLRTRVEGKDAVRGVYTATLSALPDNDLQIAGEAFTDNKLVAWGTYQATVTGPFLGQEPTGRRIALPMIVVNSFRDGLMEGEQIYFDLATLCEQAGFDIGRVLEATTYLRAAPFGG